MRVYSVILLNISTLLLIGFNSINCRKLTVELNPNCGNICDNSTNLVYIKSKGSDDLIHYLWSSITGISPTLLIVKTDLESNLTIDWKELLLKNTSQPTIHFSGKTLNSFGLELSQLFFFNDINKTGSYDPRDPTLDIDWKDFVWEKVVIPHKDSDSIDLRFSKTDKTGGQGWNGSTIAFELKVDGSDGRNEELPHLAFTESSASLAFSVVDVETENNPQFNDTNRPRLMARFLVVKEGLTDASEPTFETSTSIDDEYTPGVFDRIYLKWNSKESKSSENRDSFLHWKPIAYNSKDRIIANTVDVIHTKQIQTANTNESNSCVLEGYFGSGPESAKSFSLTFGATDATDDTDYYNKKPFVGFSLVVGLGSAPDDKLSTLVLVIILVGFGLPLLVMFGSALYLIVRRVRKRKFDDLLLNQQISD